MTSVLSWLDHDDGERRRMLEIVDLFREKGTLDELGIGPIRDTFADHFFPGTSTIQTRARYFLFIPWMYGAIEGARVPSRRADAEARGLQWRLVQSLKAGGELGNRGVIGIDAGEHLQRLPSTIYWQGLGRWGIRQCEGSIDRYHASLDQHYREERAARTSEGGELVEAARRNWHGSLPPAPPQLLERTAFALDGPEAEFLAERIKRACPNSLLAACLSSAISRVRTAGAPWDLGGIDTLPDRLREDVEAARRYSLVMEGAVFLYNRMLAELVIESGISGDAGQVERYGQELDRWAGEMEAALDDLHGWDRPAFWARLRQINPRLSHGAVRFSETWVALAIAAPRAVADLREARALIRERERHLKTTLARLHNPRALERWSGQSGVGRLVYRWPNARRILADILDGLRRQAELP